MNILFAGTPDPVSVILEHLIFEKHRVVGILTQPDNLKSRSRHNKLSTVKKIGLKYSIPIFQPSFLKSNVQIFQILSKLNIDLVVVVAYGLIIPKVLLDIPRYGWINIHMSCLPQWRGAAPIQRAIEFGHDFTGITIIQMNSNLDGGDILSKTIVPIFSNDTTPILFERLVNHSVDMLHHVLWKLSLNQLKPIKQLLHQGSYAHKLKKIDGLMDFSCGSSSIINKYRAYQPWPGLYFFAFGLNIKCANLTIKNNTTDFPPGEIIDIDKNGIQVQCVDSVININSIQFPGKKMHTLEKILLGRNMNDFIKLNLLVQRYAYLRKMSDIKI